MYSAQSTHLVLRVVALDWHEAINIYETVGQSLGAEGNMEKACSLVVCLFSRPFWGALGC